MLFLTAAALLLFVAYAVLIFFYQRRWGAIPYFVPGRDFVPGRATGDFATGKPVIAVPASAPGTAAAPGSAAASGTAAASETAAPSGSAATTGTGVASGTASATGTGAAPGTGATTGTAAASGARVTRISVLIPARNEEAGILDCLRSLARQTYPKDRFEVIVLDDHSTDGTAAMVEDFVAAGAEGLALRCLRIADVPLPSGLTAYKKFAIETGVGVASGELIVTTDADCSFDPQWLATLAAFYEEKGAKFIAAPVRIEPAPLRIGQAMHSTGSTIPPGTGHAPQSTGHASRGTLSLLGIFQTLDFITLQGITGAAVHSGFHSMCNGANLAYTRDAFYAVGRFTGIDHIPSGDDMLLMHKIYLRYPGRVFFLKNRHAIVSTSPMTRWKGFINQRVRWASKADTYDDRRIFWALLLVYLVNALFIALAAGAFFNYWWLWLLLVLLVVKTIVEFPFVQSVASFFGQQRLMVYFPLLQPLHIVYTVFVGWLGKFGSYSWKDRTIKK